MVTIVVDTKGLDAAINGLEQFSQRRRESAIAEALNNTAQSIRRDWAQQLGREIDRPTPLTRRAPVQSKRADVGRLVAEVQLQDFIAGVRTDDAPSGYLAPHEFGGGRGVKKFERALQARGAMPAGTQAVPGQYAQLDGFGNVRRQQIVQVLNQLGAGLSVGYQRVIGRTQARREQSARRAGRLYVAVPRQVPGLRAGVYERKGRAMLPVFFYVSRTVYRKRLSLVEAGMSMARRELPAQMSRAIDKRLASLLKRSGAGR